MVRSFAYGSSAKVAFDETSLETLLAGARHHNRRVGVSGILLYADGCFLQYLEGPSGAVESALQRVYASTRHRGIHVLLDEPIEARVFSEWSMGLALPPRSQFLALSSASWSEAAKRATARAPLPPGLILLTEFWRNARG